MLKYQRCLTFFSCISFLSIAQANTFDKKDVNDSKPLNISAKDGMKCNQNTHICTAYNATVTHDEITLTGEKLTAFFTQKDELDHVEAEGNVYIKSAEAYEGWGQKAFFDMKNGKGRLEHKARIKDHGQKREINAGSIDFTIKKDEHNKTSIEYADAREQVRIVTPKDVALGDTGQYEGKTQIMTLTGNVKITNMKGQLNGSKAVMNLKTGENKFFANNAKKQPVQLLLRSVKDSSTPTQQ